MQRSLLALILVALGLLGCAPTVSLRTARLTGPTPAGVRFDAVLAVENPNTFDVQVKVVRANVKVENIRGWVPVYAEPQVWIPSGRTILINVPVTVPWTMVPQIVAKTVSQPKVSYTVVGNADVVASQAYRIERNMYEFDQDGELPRSLFLTVGAGPFRIGIQNRFR